VEVAVVRDELAEALEESLLLTERLAAAARDHDVPIADLVATATMLNRLTERREELLGELRRTASAGNRATRPGPPIRERVLQALDQLGWPQNAGFCEEYLWARWQLQLGSRAFASLRRDEQRAWHRASKARDAYVVPALNPDGSANPRWLTSSEWDLARRVIASPRTERLLDLQKVAALQAQGKHRPEKHRRGGARGPLCTLLERYAWQVLGLEPPPVSASPAATRAWRDRVRSEAETEISAIRADDDAERQRIARKLTRLSPSERAWGHAP
jgi:hypothetical protein